MKFKLSETSFILSIIAIIAVFIIAHLGVKIYDQRTLDYVPGLIVQDLQQQQKISGSKNNVTTKIRFLVVTDKETFVVESSVFNWKFNNSDLFYRLEKGAKYDFEVAGIGKGAFTDYRNILSFQRK